MKNYSLPVVVFHFIMLLMNRGYWIVRVIVEILIPDEDFLIVKNCF